MPALRHTALALTFAVLGAGCPEASSPGPSDSAAAQTATARAKATASVTATASAKPTASPMPSAMAAADKDVVSVATKDAGVAGVGFELKGIANQGWSVVQIEGALFAVSGPPGGPLGLQIRAYDAQSGDNVKLFDSLVTHKPTTVGKAEKVELAGEPREAQSFRNGEGRATTAYCLIRLPAKPGAKTGLVFLSDSGMAANTEPSCAQALDAPALKPIVASFRLVP